MATKKIVHLPVKLTEEELLAKGNQQARVMCEYIELEARKKELTGDLGAQMKLKRKELDKLSLQVRSGFETRPVDCMLVPSFDANAVLTVRQDTHETIDRRPMSHLEREKALQRDLFEADDDGEQSTH